MIRVGVYFSAYLPVCGALHYPNIPTRGEAGGEPTVYCIIAKMYHFLFAELGQAQEKLRMAN